MFGHVDALAAKADGGGALMVNETVAAAVNEALSRSEAEAESVAHRFQPVAALREEQRSPALYSGRFIRRSKSWKRGSSCRAA